MDTWGCRTASFNQFSILPSHGVSQETSEFYEDANPWLLERHWTLMIDAELLRQHPECIGASLKDNWEKNPNHFVLIIFDRKTGKPIYRIARIDGQVKK